MLMLVLFKGMYFEVSLSSSDVQSNVIPVALMLHAAVGFSL